MRIGIFDSGKGGTFIAERLRVLLPDHKYLVADDSVNVPYGTRTEEEITELTDHAIQPLLKSCPIIVIACNTITTASIQVLRMRYPSTQFVGLEPMVKPASTLTRTGHITMLATPATLKSQRYQELKSLYASSVIIDEPETSSWPRIIEDDDTETIDLTQVQASCTNGSDVIVLGCTHYLVLSPTLKSILPGVKVLEPSSAIARRLRELTK